jgi:hypothetical protein
MGHVEHLQGWRAPWNEAEFISALTGGGDSRLRVDPASGTNKYFVPPIPGLRGLLQLLHRLTDLAGRLSPGDAVLLRSGNRSQSR